MRYHSRVVFNVSVAAATCLMIFPATAQQSQTPIPVTDMGLKRAGQSSSLKLKAINVNCDVPQTFEYAVTGGTWLVPPRNTTIANLGKGESGTVKATLDFTQTPPGIYYGHIYSRCTSCGWYILSACVESGEDTVIRVKVVDPSMDSEGNNLRDPGNPFTNLVAYAPPQIQLSPQVSDEDLKFLTQLQRDLIRIGRDGVIKAEANGRKAREAARLAREKKNDCDRELAILKTAMETTKRKAAITKQDAANMKGAADTAKGHVSDLKDDKQAAASKLKMALEGRAAQSEALIRAMQKDGGDGEASRSAREFERQATAKVKAARENKKAVDGSEGARKAQAAEARRQADAAKDAAKQAKTEAKTAQARHKDKAKECKGLLKPIADADKAVSDMRKFAARAVGLANDEEDKGQKQVIKTKIKATKRTLKELSDSIKAQEKDCERGKKAAQEEIERLRRGISIGERIGIFDEGTSKRASALKAVNDKIWDTAQDWAQDHTIMTVDKDGNRGVMNDDTADLFSSDTAEDLLGNVTWAMNLVADGMKGMVGGLVGMTDFQQGEILTGVRGLALAVQGQVNAMRNPNTFAALRNEAADLRKSDESFMVQEMREAGIKGRKEELEGYYQTIKELYDKPNLLTKRLTTFEDRAKKCVIKVKALKIEREKLQSENK